MFSFDLGRNARFSPLIHAGDILLRPGEPRDADAWIELRERSKSHLTQWEPDWPSDEVTPDVFRIRLKAQDRERRSGRALPLFVFDARESSSPILVGGVSLSAIRYGAACSADIGYWVGDDYLRQGFGLAAVQAVIDHAFNKLALNRLQAACQPGNVASRRLLKKAGFDEEGFACDYLFINGDWRDHCLYALTARKFHALGAPTGAMVRGSGEVAQKTPHQKTPRQTTPPQNAPQGTDGKHLSDEAITPYAPGDTTKA